MNNNCITKTKNTSASRCKFDWGLFRRTVITPRDKVFTGFDESKNKITFDEWILKGIHAKDVADRFYPMPLFSDVTDSSEEATSWTNAYGQKFFIKDGNKAFGQKYNQDYCLTNKLSTFNDGMYRRIIIFDNKGVAWLVSKGDNAEGFEGQIYTGSAGINTPTDLVEPSIEYTMRNPDDFTKKMPIETEMDVTSLEGLEDIEMIVNVGESTTEIRFVSDCGNYDVTSEMQGISDKADCWIFDGAAMETAPVYANGKFTVANSELTTKKILKLATPDVLYANGVAFKECAVGVEIIIS